MKINDIVCEAKFSKPVIMYHATERKNLKSILSKGLSREHQGTGWGHEDGGDYFVRDFMPLGGIYLTKSFGVIHQVINNIGDDGYVLVICQIQPRSGYLDEDNVDELLRGFYTSVVPSKAIYYYKKFLTDDSFKQKVIKKFFDLTSKELLQYYDYDGIVEFIKAYLLRPAAHAVEEDIKPDERNEFENEMPSSDYAEKNYRKHLDWLTKALKRIAYDENILKNDASKNIRIIDDITYSGVNKIIGILEFPRYQSDFGYIRYDKGVPSSVYQKIESQLRVEIQK